MALSLRSLKLKTRMILILGFTALLQTGAIGLFALHYLNQSMDEQMGQRALHVAKAITAMSEIIEAVEQHDSALLQPLSLRLAEKTQSRFLITD